MERFGIEEVYGMHNYPGLPVGQFAIRPGPLMASADRLTIEIEGHGGHAARPHLTVDSVLVGAQIGNPVQSSVARTVDPQQSSVVSIAADVVGRERVEENTPPVMGAEDFSFMLEARPGAFIFVGNGDSAGLHHPAYDFNDEVIPIGTSYWVKLAETALR